jgi:hypothetical protein
MAPELDFRRVSSEHGEAAALLTAMIEEIRELHDGLDLLSPDMPAAGPAEMGAARWMFLVGYRGDEAVVWVVPGGGSEATRGNSLAACSPESSKNWAKSSTEKTSRTRLGW